MWKQVSSLKGFSTAKNYALEATAGMAPFIALLNGSKNPVYNIFFHSFENSFGQWNSDGKQSSFYKNKIEGHTMGILVLCIVKSSIWERKNA